MPCRMWDERAIRHDASGVNALGADLFMALLSLFRAQPHALKSPPHYKVGMVGDGGWRNLAYLVAST